MREIKFRYRLRNRENGNFLMVYALLYSDLNGTMQFPLDLSVWEVLDIDEWTGFADKNGKEIYEGDFVLAKWRSVNQTWKVYLDETTRAWDITGCNGIIESLYDYYIGCVVVGNKHENPEMFVQQ